MAASGPVPKGDKPLDPAILAAARRANPGASVAMQGALTARAAADAAAEAAAEAERAAGMVQRRTVIVNAAPKSRGQARKFSRPVQEQYLDLLRKAVTPPQAAAACGVSTNSVKAAMKADPAFADEVKAARADATAPIVEAMWELALSGSFAAQKYLLENMAPEDWKDPKNIKVEVTGQIESVEAGGRGAQIERIQRLEARLAERLALRAAGDEVEAQIEDAELVDDAPQIEGAGHGGRYHECHEGCDFGDD